MSRKALVSLAVVALALSPATARAAWGPDSVLFLGGPGYPYGIGWGALLPAGGGGVYAFWHAPVQSGCARVTSEGGRVFSSGGDDATGPHGVATDGSGAFLNVFITYYS